ncbi:hypothetical protein [Endozoicomonas lisbonensis]|uniref:Secreted protein n=1 Tax=Endozoicomonas lisbonensis TaxID=3120522 RepID=A0ABV2SDW0_9GAMM
MNMPTSNKFSLLVTAAAILCGLTVHLQASPDTTHISSAEVKTGLDHATDNPVKLEPIAACLKNPDGEWLPGHNECEFMSEQTCQELNGEMDECASACRHHPESEMCISLCVPVCKFGE